MHIMVNKRYMQKCDICVGHKAHINNLLLNKPPGILSVDNASSVCEQCANEPSMASEKSSEKERNKRQLKYKIWTEEGDEIRVRR